MKQILDLHIHSKYSRACSPQLTLENIDKACRVKGVDVVATGDFTYPAWFSSIKNELEPIKYLEKNSGLYKLKEKNDEKIKFILSTEFALIYKDGDRARRIHLVIHAPCIEAVQELNNFLDKKYNIKSDGRPILGIKAPELIKLLISIHPNFLIYPAHIWTPWFSVFGSKSGFNKLDDCFREYTNNIYAYETGLSSDPEMNWRISALDSLTLISNSDALSLNNIGREANVFDLDNISYNEIYSIIKNKNKSKIKYSIEFYPEEGMYHYDGHRACGISFSPDKTKKNKGICPVCKKSLVVGVLNRVEELADRPVAYMPDNVPGYKKLVGLYKIIADALNIKSKQSNKVLTVYNELIKNGGSEFNILIDLSLDELKNFTEPIIVEGIKRVRQGKLQIDPGFDGQYGQIKIFNEKEKITKQLNLF